MRCQVHGHLVLGVTGGTLPSPVLPTISNAYLDYRTWRKRPDRAVNGTHIRLSEHRNLGPECRLSGPFQSRLTIIIKYLRCMAEREGFEPSIRFWRILTFQASAFDHSATAPHALDEGGALACGWRFRKARRCYCIAALSMAAKSPPVVPGAPLRMDMASGWGQRLPPRPPAQPGRGRRPAPPGRTD